MSQPPYGTPPFGYRPSQYHYPPQQQQQQQQYQSYAPPPYHQQQFPPHYPPQPPYQQTRPPRAQKPKPKPIPEPKFSFTDLKSLPWICENCNRYFTDVFEAGSHEMVTGHDKGREMTEKEVLEKREEEKRVELEGLRKEVIGKNGVSASQTTAPVGYQAKMQTYTPSTIPGLGPVSNGEGMTGLARLSTSTPTPTPQSSSEGELNGLRRENASLQFQIKDLKTKVLPRIDALAEDLKSLNSKTTEHELQIHYLVMERDQLKAEVDGLKGVEVVDVEHEELDLVMDSS